MSRVCGNRRSGDAVSSLFYNNAVHVWNILYLSVRLMLLSQISRGQQAYTFSVGYRWNIIICRTTVPHFLIHYFYDLYQVSLKILLICFSVFWVFFVVFGLFVRMPLSTCWGLPIIPCDHMNVHLSFLWRYIKVKII